MNELLNELADKNVHWNRVNDKTIIVYMSSNGNGSHHTDLDNVSRFLSKSFFEFERGFDNQCGKGFAVFKQLKNKGDKK